MSIVKELIESKSEKEIIAKTESYCSCQEPLAASGDVLSCCIG